MSVNLRHLSRRYGIEIPLFREIAQGTTHSKTSQSGMNQNGSIEALAQRTGLSSAVVKGTASFYDFLDQPAAQRQTLVCHGTACRVTGSSSATAAAHPEAGRAMCCGLCYRGGALLKTDEAGRLDGYHQAGEGLEQPEMPVFNLSGIPILTSSVASVEALYAIAVDRRERILDQLEASGLRGRGGAGFGFAFKCRATAQAPGEEKFVVCNGDEGDPGAFSDRYLLESQPHKVMAGMFAAGLAAGAKRGLLYIRYEYPEAIRRVEAAIAEFEALPEALRGEFHFQVVPGAGSYVCGEETALLSSIEGLRPEVRVRPPYPAQSGLWGKPTLLSNVETFANIPWIVEHGGQAFAAIGSEGSKGTKLISLDSQFTRPGLYEVDFGHPFAELVHDAAGGFTTGVKALQVGGPLGAIVPLSSVESLSLDFESFQQAGFALGHAGIIAIPERFPMIELMRHLFDYMAEESCGKCTPCRLGTAKGSRMLAVAEPGHPVDRQLFDDLLELLAHGSLCALGGGLPLPMRNVLDHFGSELAPYFSAWEQN
ncbi:MAG: NADH-ubiquinone oxidoreductase-F iron-sulfur binding region domain-containing protein [Candidatus Thiodiazotropha sp.]